MKTSRIISLLLLNLGLFMPAAQAGNPQSHKPVSQEQSALRIVVQGDVYQDYVKFLGSRNVLDIKSYGGAHTRRDVVEMVLLQQALQLGGENRPLHFMQVNSTSRIAKLLSQNQADISGTSQWKELADTNAAHLAVSQALISEGKFMAGVYFPADHPGLKKIQQQPESIKNFTAVCARAWTSDRTALKQLGSPILLTENWTSILGMLKKKRADFVLAPFQASPDISFKTDTIVLKPVPGIQVSLAGSRHFLLSKDAENAAALEQKLNHGLQELEKNGRIRQAYRESGFEDPRTLTWRRLN